MPLIIREDTTWKAGETQTLKDSVQIAHGVTLTIEDGVTVNGNGFEIQTFGTIRTTSSENIPIVFNNVKFSFGPSSNTPGHLEISNAVFYQGIFLASGGYGSFSINDSIFYGLRSQGSFSIWYPVANSDFSNNLFVQSAGFEILTRRDVSVSIQDNSFYQVNVTNGRLAIIEILANYNQPESILVSGNNFFDANSIKIQLPEGYDSAKLYTIDNFFEGATPSTAEQFVLDNQDSLARASDIILIDQRVTPNPNAPASPRTQVGEIGINQFESTSITDIIRNNALDNQGNDTVVFSGNRSDYAIVKLYSLTLVSDLTAERDGKDLLFDIERLVFDDLIVRFDLDGITEYPYANGSINATPTGLVSITGTVRQGEVLTASNTLADIDGLGAIAYQWRSNGNNINGATGSTYTLTQAEVGKAITVVASYTDLFGSAESVASGASQIVDAVLAATYTNPISSIDSIGVSPDGQYLLIKIDGATQSVPVGSFLSFNGSTVTTSDLTNSITVQPVFQSSGGSNGYALPEVFTGPASLNLHYQLIETADNAIVIGGNTNDFIKVASTNSSGKAVDAGGGNDVIDGGVGSTFIMGGSGSNTIFLDGRAPGVSWSTVTDFKLGVDKATIWGWKPGVSNVNTAFTDVDTGGAPGYTGLTLHFENLLPDDAGTGQTNPNLNSITLSGLRLSDFGASSLQELSIQIASGLSNHFQVGSVSDQFGDHGYLYLS